MDGLTNSREDLLSNQISPKISNHQASMIQDPKLIEALVLNYASEDKNIIKMVKNRSKKDKKKNNHSFKTGKRIKKSQMNGKMHQSSLPATTNQEYLRRSSLTKIAEEDKMENKSGNTR